ncbi:MAG: ShlB/FhaC/HecB family hemolysin secretion/activation protein [Burkholderiales bacterium]|nr:ShlB/FhaC/HecB family hemolysin secretion/activation protein [Burkholderiales bacterium]
MLLTLVFSAAAAQTNVESPRFDIAAYQVDGASLIAADRLQAAVQTFTGPGRDFEAVHRALRAVEKAYADAGYTAVQVLLPEQELKDGRIRLQVIELRLGQLQIEGQRHFDEENIRRTLPALQPGEPPNVDAVARNLRTANENPAKNTTVLFKAGEEPGTVDATARVTDQKPWRAAFTLDTTGTPNTGTLRTAVALQHANLFNRDQVLSGQYITSPEYPSRVSVFGLGYHIPLYRLGDSVDLAYVYSDVDSGQVSTAAGRFGISGSGNFYLARYNFNLPRRGDWDQRIIFGLDWREYQNDVRFGGTGASLVPDITVHPASVGYSARHRTQQHDLSGFLSAYQNLPGGSDGNAAAFNRPGARPGAKDDYQLLRYGFSWLQSLPRDFQIRTAASGQWTNDLLVSGEQFGIGGMDSVRGFIEREIAADRGWRGSIEGYSPEWSTGTDKALRLRAIAFFDYGYVKRNGPLPGELRSESVSSAGVGLRGFYRDSVSLRLDFAEVIQPGGLQGKGDQRLQGSVSIFF